MYFERHNDKKLAYTLLIVRTGSIAFHGRHLIYNGWRRNECITYSSTNIFFRKLMDHGVKGRKRHNLALEKFQLAYNKTINFIDKWLR